MPEKIPSPIVIFEKVSGPIEFLQSDTFRSSRLFGRINDSCRHSDKVVTEIKKNIRACAKQHVVDLISSNSNVNDSNVIFNRYVSWSFYTCDIKVRDINTRKA